MRPCFLARSAHLSVARLKISSSRSTRCMAATGAPQELLQAAIARGAPAFNAGRPDDCYRIYRQTAEQLLASSSLSPGGASSLKEGLAAAAGAGDASASAWAMRRAFDAILDGSADSVAAVQAAAAAGAPDWPIVDFASSSGGQAGPRFGSMDDGVMGGLSRSTWSWQQGGQGALFAGEVSTQRNGGFASVRSAPSGLWAAGLARARGMRLLVRGDGRVYKLVAKTDDGFDGVSYQQDFATTASPASDGGWQAVDLPLSGFRPVFRGQPLAGAPPLEGGAVRQLGFMCSKFSDAGGLTPGFQPGAFRLAVGSVRGYL